MGVWVEKEKFFVVLILIFIFDGCNFFVLEATAR
jgi:hypothetical protein